MADIQDLRARARETAYRPERSSGSLPFWLIAGVAVAAGFAGVMFAPRFFSTHSTGVVYVEAPRGRAATAPMPADADRYVGKSADEVATMADAVCAARAGSVLLAPINGEEQSPKGKAEFDRAKQTVANGKNVPDQNERLACQLTEAPARYCSRSLRQKITAGVIDYVRGIENTNLSLRMYFTAQAAISLDQSRGRTNPDALGAFAPDPRVIEGVEGLIRAGYLLKPQRDDIGTSAPRAIKERLDRIVGNKAHCPEAPWWAFWR
ncbi:MAG TPA: hypothetical protein VFE89_01270 [Beijerinckiaceae bacterium]|jgi:hypothetical protein|nr:hypothetical protein [Beijerinckiaceae bacterium]